MFHFYTGAHFLLPQRANYGKGPFCKLQNRMRQRGLSAWGIQTGPFASLKANFVLTIFHLLHFHSEGPFLITPRGLKRRTLRNGQLESRVVFLFRVPAAFIAACCQIYALDLATKGVKSDAVIIIPIFIFNILNREVGNDGLRLRE